jgi:hypothetical protein
MNEQVAPVEGSNADAAEHGSIDSLLGNFSERNHDRFVFLVRSNQRLVTARKLTRAGSGGEC